MSFLTLTRLKQKKKIFKGLKVILKDQKSKLKVSNYLGSKFIFFLIIYYFFITTIIVIDFVNIISCGIYNIPLPKYSCERKINIPILNTFRIRTQKENLQVLKRIMLI
jgi:hypothetical protein